MSANHSKAKPLKPNLLIALGVHFQALKHEANRSIAFPPGWDDSPTKGGPRHSVRLPEKIAGSHLYSTVENGLVRAKFLVQEHGITDPGHDSNPDCSILSSGH